MTAHEQGIRRLPTDKLTFVYVCGLAVPADKRDERLCAELDAESRELARRARP